MRISAKGRYALAATAWMAEYYDSGDFVTVVNISEKLSISKIYLEQIFSLLKRANLLLSAKGSKGGYQLAKAPKEISALEILEAVEVSLFERTEDTVIEKAPELNQALRKLVFNEIDTNVQNVLLNICLSDIVAESEALRGEDEFIYYI